MKKQLSYSITIAASRQHVWETMLHPDTYKIWTGAGWPDSYFEGEWEQGNNMRFIGPDGSGTLAKLVEHRPHEFIFANHIAILNPGGEVDTESEVAKNWIGTTECYTFSETADGVTHLLVEINAFSEWEQMFNDGWPDALKKLKAICEGRNHNLS